MKEFERAGHEGVTFFVGPEIEQSPAFGKKTLFVVGLQDTAIVEKHANDNQIKHIFLTANRSFDTVELKDGVYVVGNTLASDWAKQIAYLLNRNFMVSIDYPAHKHVMLLAILDQSIWQSRNFVPILSVAVPHVTTSSPNLTIKIDDINFKATNPGVWCMNYTEVTDSNRFTSWSEYADDMVITDAPVAVAPLAASVKSVKIPEQVAPVAAEVTPTVNDADVGLDMEPVTALKPEAASEEVVSLPVEIKTAEGAADAYADGATADPLSKEESKKPKAKK